MNDREQLEAMLTRADVAFLTIDDPELVPIDWERVDEPSTGFKGIVSRDVLRASVLIVRAGDKTKHPPPLSRNFGHGQFSSQIAFDEDGMIIWWGTWE